MKVKTDLLRYRGVRRNGSATVGAVDAHESTPAWLAQKFYEQGFKSLSITRNDDPTEVGGIGPTGDRRRPRDWWGECF